MRPSARLGVTLLTLVLITFGLMGPAGAAEISGEVQAPTVNCTLDVTAGGFTEHRNAEGELTSLDSIPAVGGVECTAPMSLISLDVLVTDPQGQVRPLAGGACTYCSSAPASAIPYTCTQGNGQNCSGKWVAGYQATLQLPAGAHWGSVTEGCSIQGTSAVCEGIQPKVIPLFNTPKPPVCPEAPAAIGALARPTASAADDCIELPDGVTLPELDYLSIQNIRAFHFPGGKNVDDSKGLFNKDLTDGQLEKIFNAGLRDSMPFEKNGRSYYEKTFNYSGVGTSSAQKGSLPSTQIALVISKHGDVVTMYPV
ncbi:hypothetical protein [Streptomyces celluloflavus]